jgi:phosphoribosylformylglycinamidine cyclo-ligase
MDLEGEQPELGRTLGAELCTPSHIYTPACLALARSSVVHAFAHITGGGIAANMARVLPPDADAVIDRRTWRPPAVFRLLADRGAIPGGLAGAEMERVFNLGVGMTAVVPAPQVSRVLGLLAAEGVRAWVAGEILPGSGGARLTGSYPA